MPACRLMSSLKKASRSSLHRFSPRSVVHSHLIWACVDTGHYVKGCVKRDGTARTEGDLHPRAVLCTPVLPRCRSPPQQMVTPIRFSLSFNWKVKSLPGSSRNQYIFGLMALIKKPCRRAIRKTETLACLLCRNRYIIIRSSSVCPYTT